MILCPISEFHRYARVHPRFTDVARLLAREDLKGLPEGRHELEGDEIYIISAPEARTRPAEGARLEAHRAYVDVQIILEGQDTMAWAPVHSCRSESEPYDPTRDIVFFEDAHRIRIPVRAGELVVFFPEDAHAPLIGDGETVRKLVVKVRVQGAPAGNSGL